SSAVEATKVARLTHELKEALEQQSATSEVLPGQATTLMYALFAAATNHIRCGNYAAAHTQVDELMALADERGAPYWKAFGTAVQGWIFASTGKASDAVRVITAGITSL